MGIFKGHAAYARALSDACQASRANRLRCSALVGPVSSTIEDNVASVSASAQPAGPFAEAAVAAVGLAGACRRRWGCPASTTLPSERTTTYRVSVPCLVSL